MSKEKQIEEKHELSESIYMSGYGLLRQDCDDIAEQLYTEGYRKQSEVAREIINSITTITKNKPNSKKYGLAYRIGYIQAMNDILSGVYELRKKYMVDKK